MVILDDACRRVLLYLIISGTAFVIGCGSRTVVEQPVADPMKVSPTGTDLRLAPLPRSLVPPAPSQLATDKDWFEDVTAKSGVDFRYSDGSDAGLYEILESVGGGIGLLDYDSDGDMDLLLAGGGEFRPGNPKATVAGRPCSLYRNDGDWKFTDVTAEVGLSDSQLYSHGITIGDIDNDHDPDIFLAGHQGVRLYRNNGGKFHDYTSESGLVCPEWNVVGAFADIDNDGLLDLYVVTYAVWEHEPRRICINDCGLRDVCGPTGFPGIPDKLFRNLGDGKFEDISKHAGITHATRGLGVVAADFDGDRRIDFYITNDVQENLLYLNGESGVFREEALVRGCALSVDGLRQGSMGVDASDVDRDGLIDLWYLNFATEDNSLLNNTGRGFVDVTSNYGLMGVSRPWVGFGTAFADFNRDGFDDLVLTNGHVAYGRKDAPYLQPAQLFASVEGNRFRLANVEGGPYFSQTHSGRGLVVGDLDNNGTPDLIVMHQNEPVRILRNRAEPAAWLRVELHGTKHNYDAVGAVVRIESSNTKLASKWILGGGGYLSHSDRRVLFALPNSNPVRAVVTWPNGEVESFSNLDTGRSYVLNEGKGDVR